MRLLHALTTLLAVLCGAVSGDDNAMANVSHVSRVRRSPTPHPHHHQPHRVLTDEELDSTAAWKRSHWREMQSVLRHEGQYRNEVECCPSVLEMVAKKGGKTPTGLYVELYEDEKNKQRLYELSCAPDVVDRPCRFVDARLYNQSRCVQKYSYSYALVRYTTPMTERHRTEGHFSVPGSGGWSMDYVSVRAGCECEIAAPRKKNTHRKRLERHKLKKTKRRMDEDET